MKRKKVSTKAKKRRRQRRRFLQHVEQLELRAGPTDLLGVAVGAAFLGDMLLVEPIAAEYSFVGKSDDSKFGLESASRDADTPLQTSLTVFEPVSPSIVENPGATLVAGNPNYQPRNRSAPSATIDSAIGTAMASAGSTELRTIDDPPASASAGSTVRSASLSSFSSTMATIGIQTDGSASTGVGSQNQSTGTFDAAAGAGGPIGQQSFATASSPVSASQSSSANGTADGEGVTADLTASESTSSDSTANSTTIEAGTVAAAQDSSTDSDFPLPDSLALVFPDSLDFSEPPSDTDFPDLPIPGAPGETVILAGPETEIITPHQQIEPGEANTFAGEFVVQLQPEVSSEALAAEFGFVHSFSYPNTEENLNVWRTPDEVAPGTRLFGWMRTNADNPERIAQLLESRPEVLDAYPVYKTSVAPKSIFNDPLLPAQWHLFNVGQSGGTPGLDGNVQAAWDLGVTGKGVTIGIVDDGLQYTHPDLGAPGLAFNTDGGNFIALASYDFNFSDDDPSPTTTTDFHGTAVAGVAAAIGNNGIGGAGVAPGANIGGIRLIAAATSDFQEAQALDWDTSISGQFDGSLIDIYSNSWGPFDNGTVQASGPLVQVAFSDSVANGRGGLGTIYTWAGGNGRTNNDNVNYDGYANQRQVIAVAAVDHTGVVAFYSEPGAALLISAPSSGGGEGITTTDLVGTDGYHRTDNTDDFGGTSSATPYVSGVIALMLEVNPNLSWRDVQHILVQSAIRNDASDSDWVINGGGRPVNHNYGFGLINASGAVNLASNWQSVGPELLIDSGLETISTTIPDNDTTGLTRNITISSNIRVEHVEIIFDADHTDRGDLEVILTSPSGIESTLAEQRGQDSGNNYQDWVFSSTRHWDELSAGTWSLRVRDLDPGQTGTWNTWRLRIYGTELTADTSGPRVTGITDVNGVVNGGSVSSFEVQFDEPVAPGTFTAADVSFARVGGSSISVTAVTPVDLPGIPALGTTIEGIDFNENAANGGFFSIPPDPIGAAGPNHLVSVVNTSIEWHTKSGLQQHSQALGTSGGGGFFSSLTPANNTFDPKVIYDQHADRFVVVSLERVDTGAPSPNPGNSSRVLIAVSDDSNPNGTWHFQAIDTKLTIGGLQRWFDYPGIAVDEEAIYLTGNMFAFSANGFTFGGTRLWIIDKGLGSGGLYDGATSTFTLHDVGAISGFDITTMPAQVFGTAPGTTGTWLVQYSGLSNGASEFLNLVRIDDPLGTPTFEQDFINLGSIEANPLPALPDAPQQGSSVEIETNDSRALHAVWRDDSLWMTMTIVPESGPDAGQATAHWVEIDTTTLSTPALADQGNVGGEDIAAGTHTFFPSIAVDANGNMGIGFAASGPNIFAGAYYTGRLATDAPGTVRPTGVLAAGQDVYVRAFGGPRNRWGDYSGISIDPTNEATFWVFNEYALPRGTDFGDTFMGEAQDGRWGTRWGSFSFAPTTFTVDFAPQSTTGNYRIDIGPGIEDLAGNNLNQNGNSTNGEATQDKFTEFFTLAEQFIYSNTTTGSIPDLGSLTRTISLPSVDVADLNVLLNISHVFASFDLTISLAAPGVSSLLIADRNTANGNGISNNGYLDTILDDDNLSAPLIDATTTDFHYTGQYRPTNALSAFDGNRTAGTWTLTVADVFAPDQGTFNNFSLLVTPAGLVDVALDSVTNTDGDRDQVEVTYTVTGGTASPFDLGVYESTDPFFNINSDPNTGTFTVTTGLTEGTHTVEIDASLFPDPSFTRNQELYSLVVVDPQHNILDQHRFNNQGILSGVTLTPDGTLYIAGNPFTANTVTLSGSTVTFNGTPISYDSGATNDVFFVGGNKADTFTATGVNENILAFMGPGNDTYTGGNLIDVVQGGPGDDILSGNNGNDRLFGLQGNDTVSGGAGDNLLSVGAGTGQTINAVGGGNDRFLIGGTVFNDHVTVWDPDGDPNNVGGTLQATVQNPVNPSGFGAVTVQSVTISGVGSSDLLFVGTGPGNDLIQLQSETPNFGSGVGNSIVGIDAVVGAGAGSDTVFGGRGSDLLFGDQFAVATAGAGDGNDTIDSRDGIQGNDTLFGAGGTNTLISDTNDVENDG